jgi:hypothetical protein
MTTLFVGSVETAVELPIGQWLSERDRELPPGLYFARFRVGDWTETIRIVWAP